MRNNSYQGVNCALMFQQTALVIVYSYLGVLIFPQNRSI